MAALRDAAAVIRDADALLVATGAGMGVDSGLGTFRGRNAGVWAPLRALGRDFTELSCPDVFESDPRLAWAFWRFRYVAYTRSEPHEGYAILSRWGASKRGGIFSVTSNIDGHWARTAGVGPELVYEVHGALTHMQRAHPEEAGADRGPSVWPTDGAQIEGLRVPDWSLAAGEAVEVQAGRGGGASWVSAVVGDDGCALLTPDGRRAMDGVNAVRRVGGDDLCRVHPESALPVDAHGRAARPNVLMFGDWSFDSARIDAQESRLHRWLGALGADAKIALVEIGAGSAVPTIRRFSEGQLRRRANATLVRINLDESGAPAAGSGIGRDRCISVPGLGALEALRGIDAELSRR